ncbi:MAG: protein involved in polysaccharide export with SLBB domain [Bacteroidia bacterium]|jgi:protein involved in polysaccharide export with SLBB domain
MNRLICILILLLSLTPVQGQVNQQDQIDAAQAALADAGVEQDEVKRRLRAKGIDLDNIQPNQLGTLEAEIRAVVEEIQQEQSDEEDADDTDKNADDADSETQAPAKEKVVSSKVQPSEESVKPIKDLTSDSIETEARNKMKQLSRKSADEVIRRMKQGATLDEAIYDVLTKEEKNQYSAQSSVYGMDVFFNKSLDVYRTTSSTTTPDSYVLDVGDKIAINIFGASQTDLLYEIQDDGFIRPRGIAKIYLRGVSLKKAKALLLGRFRQSYVFSPGQFEVTLHTARTITVNIFGEVNQPGSYTISALNTALNAIIVAGGPGAEASLRNIEIRSSGKKRILDVYEFMIDPKKQYNFYLSNNDLIYIPKFKKRVSVTGGGIRRGASYELKSSENYNEAVRWAGGYATSIYGGLVQHIYTENGEQAIKDYELSTIEAADLKLNDGDQLIFHSSLKGYDNYVSITGAVRHPGNFELMDNMKLSDVLEKARLEKESYNQMAYLTRKNTDGTFQLKRVYVEDVLANPSSEKNIPLQHEDRIVLYTKSQFVDNYNFTISGAVRSGGTHFWDPSKTITLYDAIMMSRGFQSAATPFGYIISSPPGQPLKREYQVVDLKTAFENPESSANIIINPSDRIVVPSSTSYMDQYYVKISGAVRSPGQYVFDSTLSFKDILVMAGGLKMEAASNKIDIFRLKVEKNEPTETYATTIEIDHNLNALQDNIPFEIKPYDHIVVRTTPNFEPIKYVTINGQVQYPGIYALMKPNERLSSIIDRAGGYTVEAFPEAGTFYRGYDSIGYVVTRMDLLDNRPYDSRFNIALKEGDVITVPKLIDIVQIDKLGTNADSIYIANRTGGNELNIVLNYFNRRAKWYVNQYAGGYSKDAKRKKTTVTYANGRIKKTRSFLFFKVYPKVKRGSEIHLALKDKVIKQRNEKDEGFKPKEEKKSLLERMTELNAITAITTSIMLTTQTLITVVNGTK